MSQGDEGTPLTCPLRPSLRLDAQSCLLIDLHLPAVVACGRVCVAFALLSPQALGLSDKSVRRRRKKEKGQDEVLWTKSRSPLFQRVLAIQDDICYRGAHVRGAAGYEGDVAGDGVIKPSPGGGGCICQSHSGAVRITAIIYRGKKRSHDWEAWTRPLDALSLKLTGFLPVGRQRIRTRANVRRCCVM